VRVLLFGASGFIGGHVKPVLENDSRIEHVVAVGRARCDLVGGSPEALTELVAEERPDAVVNCTGRLTGTGHELVLANTVVTAKLVEAVAKGAPGARLVRLGSAAEYGVVEPGVSVAETHPADPVSEYGASHLAGTLLVRMAAAQGRVDGIVLRVFNPIGAGLHEDNMLGRCAALLRRAKVDGSRKITLGSLDAVRDFVDVRDVAGAILAAVVTIDRTARVCNVASGRAVTARETVHSLAEVAGWDGDVVERGTGPARSALVPWMRGDVSLARRTLGWTPSVELAESLKQIWAAVR
jgi:nucleoside-diphosphate-sugar epimerase